MITTNLTSLIHWIETQQKFKPKIDLTHMRKALHMNHIQMKDTYMIHVAGTNGKGSVTQFLTQIFMAQGLTVGTFSSPYILNFNERITINDKPLSDVKLLQLLIDVKSFNESLKEPLSFFELLTLAAFMTFQPQHLDVVIMEVGIGGLLDATNAYDDYDLSLITNIGFDHMKQLGHTLESIAMNKLGILRKNGRLLTTVDEGLHSYFKTYTKPLNIDVTFVNDDFKLLTHTPLKFNYKNTIYQSGLAGSYQLKNAILAIEAAKASPFNIEESSLYKGIKSAYLPARFTQIKDKVIIDGAHNTHAINVLGESLKTQYPHHHIHIIFSALADKDIKPMLKIIEMFADAIDLVSFPDPRFQSLEAFEDNNISYITMDAIQYLKRVMKEKSDNDVIVVTGSLHFTGYILNHFK